MKRVRRPRLLTPEEYAKYDAVRAEVMNEFPRLVTQAELRAAGHEAAADLAVMFQHDVVAHPRPAPDTGEVWRWHGNPLLQMLWPAIGTPAWIATNRGQIPLECYVKCFMSAAPSLQHFYDSLNAEVRDFPGCQPADDQELIIDYLLRTHADHALHL